MPYRSTAPVPRGIPPRGVGAEQIVRLWDAVEKNSLVIGDLDVLGYRRPISCLRESVFGLCTAPYIAVLRMNRNGQKSPSTPWMWKNNIAGWTWPGYEGQTVSVDADARADERDSG